MNLRGIDKLPGLPDHDSAEIPVTIGYDSDEFRVVGSR